MLLFNILLLQEFRKFLESKSMIVQIIF